MSTWKYNNKIIGWKISSLKFRKALGKFRKNLKLRSVNTKNSKIYIWIPKLKIRKWIGCYKSSKMRISSWKNKRKIEFKDNNLTSLMSWLSTSNISWTKKTIIFRQLIKKSKAFQTSFKKCRFMLKPKKDNRSKR
jgi:hypothetical protein